MEDRAASNYREVLESRQWASERFQLWKGIGEPCAWKPLKLSLPLGVAGCGLLTLQFMLPGLLGEAAAWLPWARLAMIFAGIVLLIAAGPTVLPAEKKAIEPAAEVAVHVNSGVIPDSEVPGTVLPDSYVQGENDEEI